MSGWTPMESHGRAAELFCDDDRVFKNKVIVSRAERHASRDKESKERALLEKRPAQRGQKYINYGSQIASADAGTVAHITEQERFITDFAAEEKKRREFAYKQKQEQLNRRRYELVMHEEARWDGIEKEYARMEEKEDRRKARGVPRNQSSVPYNPMTLEYEDSVQGDQLRYSDELIRYRAALRAEQLRCQQTKEGYNLITGEPASPVKLPPQPQPRSDR